MSRRGASKRGFRGVSGLVALLLLGCSAQDFRYGDSLNRGEDALQAAEQEAILSFGCPAMKADRRVGKLHEGDAEGGLFSEYLVRVSGCGHAANFRVSCREGGLCSVEE